MYYSPVRHSTPGSKLPSFPFDLHVLGMPPAFNLSQDQTLQFKFVCRLRRQILARCSQNSEFNEFACIDCLLELRNQTDVSTHTNYLI